MSAKKENPSNYIGRTEEGIRRLIEREKAKVGNPVHLNRRKELHRENIATLREEFDDRVGAYEGGPLREIPFLGLVLPEFVKYFTQVGAGWTDWLQPEGMEKIENRRLNWDPVNKRYGPGTDIDEEQANLQAVLDYEDVLKEKYEGISSRITEFNELEESQRRRLETIKESGVDEALNYIGIEEIRELLRK